MSQACSCYFRLLAHTGLNPTQKCFLPSSIWAYGNIVSTGSGSHLINLISCSMAVTMYLARYVFLEHLESRQGLHFHCNLNGCACGEVP